jgi:hypothetical protein
MKQISMILAGAAILTACAGDMKEQALKEQEQFKHEIASLQTALELKQQYLGSLHSRMNAIMPIAGEENTSTRHIELTEKIDLLDSLLTSYELEINAMEVGLWEEQTSNQQLHMEMTALLAELSSNEHEITALLNDLEQATFDNAYLRETLQSQEGAFYELDDRHEQLNESYNRRLVAIGSRSELESAGFIERKGIPLFKKTVISTAQNSQAQWNVIDATKHTSFSLYSRHAALHTSHPENSYQLISDEQGILTLTILDPNAFWMYSRCLVISTK